jgi:hypothetical protein
MVGAFADLGVSNFDVSVLKHLEDGNDVTVEGRQLTNAHYREVRFRIGKLLVDAEEEHWSVVLRPRPVRDVLPVQLDDLDRRAIDTIDPFSFLVIETSPGNCQSWIALRRPRQKDLSVFWGGLRRFFGADTSASGASRIAGSINFKRKYAPNFPSVRIESLHAKHIVTCEDLEAAGLIAPAPPPAVESRTFPRPQGKRGWPDYAEAFRGAPLRADGSGKDRSKADCMWCKWAAERGHSEQEIAARLIEVSEKAREEVARGNESYAMGKTRWGTAKAGK